MKNHEAFGDPDAPYELTKRDERRQREAVGLRDAVHRMHFHAIVTGESAGCSTSHTHDGDEVGHLHAPARRYPARADGGFIEELGPSTGNVGPPIRREAAEMTARLLKTKTPDDQLMRWRLRLFCGHVVERTAHISHTDVTSAFGTSRACPECGLDPATIVAGKPLGPKAERVATKPSAEQRASRMSAVTKRLRRAEAEVERLRGELTELRDDPTS